MAIKIQNTAALDVSNGVKTVVYGGAGTGKTRLCASAPSPIIVSAESGLLSLSDGEVDFIEVNSLKQFDEVYRWAKGSEEANNYETICLDSLSEIAEVLVAELIPQYKDGRQAYKALADAMMPMLRKFRDLKEKHTCFTVKMIRIKDEDSGATTDELLMPGQVLGNQIPYMVDELFYMTVDRKGNSLVQTAPSRTAFCKDRSGALDNPEEPNLTKIIHKIQLKSKRGN